MAQINYGALGQRIRRIRRQKSLTQERLGELCGLSAAHIGHIERGTRIPSLDTVYSIACELGVSIDCLMFDSYESGEGVFSALSATLEGKSEAKVSTFLAAVKALADKIDEL